MSSELSAELIAEALRPTRLGELAEHYPVALTTESLALSWLRQRHGPHGAVVVADCEIAARDRSGAPLGSGDGLAASVILRPDLAIDYQDILWAVALIAGCRGLESQGISGRAWWPESIVDDEGIRGHIRAETQLGPGRVDSSVLTFRMALPGGLDVSARLATLAATLLGVEELLEMSPVVIAETFGEWSALDSEPVRINLRPSGATGGRSVGVDERGGFGIAATSGSVTRHAVDQIRSIELRG